MTLFAQLFQLSVNNLHSVLVQDFVPYVTPRPGRRKQLSDAILSPRVAVIFAEDLSETVSTAIFQGGAEEEWFSARIC